MILIGPKPSGLGLRSDEIALLEGAAREIGQDLDALEVEQLQSLASRLATEKAVLLARS